jgi:hypothetical protein
MTIALVVVGCNYARKGNDAAGIAELPTPAGSVIASSAPAPALVAQEAQSVRASYQPEQQPPLDSARAAQPSAQAVERKIIRNAEIIIETDSPNVDQRKIAAIAEKHGGFVITSESREAQGNAQVASSTIVTIVARVPAAQFGAAVEEIHGIGGRILREKISGQDVTEEYIDLEARIRTKRALEMQFLEIMKQARKVSDALEVQNQLAEVRTEIERLEGRRRFLENQAALSTITITLQTPAPIVAATTSGFRRGVKMAFGDGMDLAAEIVLGVIRFVIVMIPVALLILLPCWLLFRWLRRYIAWPRKTEAALSGSERPE